MILNTTKITLSKKKPKKILITVACGWRGLKNFFCNNQQFQCYLTSYLKTIKKLEWLSRVTELLYVKKSVKFFKMTKTLSILIPVTPGRHCAAISEWYWVELRVWIRPILTSKKPIRSSDSTRPTPTTSTSFTQTRTRSCQVSHFKIVRFENLILCIGTGHKKFCCKKN